MTQNLLNSPCHHSLPTASALFLLFTVFLFIRVPDIEFNKVAGPPLSITTVGITGLELSIFLDKFLSQFLEGIMDLISGLGAGFGE